MTVLALRRAGRYVCTVTLCGEHVTGSPFTLRVVPAALDAVASGICARGVPPATAGQEACITLVLRDSYGNAGPAALGAQLQAQLRCPANGLAQRAAVSAQGGGVYTVRVRPELACRHELHAWVVNADAPGAACGRAGALCAPPPQPLGGMPYEMQVRPSALSCGMSGEAISAPAAAPEPPATKPHAPAPRAGGGREPGTERGAPSSARQPTAFGMLTPRSTHAMTLQSA